MGDESESAKAQVPGLMLGLMVSWVSQLLLILTGFIVPRMIDRSLGADTLGVWDLGWTMVSYFSLLEAGIGSSINRHVALHHAGQDPGQMNRIVSSVAMLQRVVGGVVVVLTLLLSWKLQWILPEVPPVLMGQAKWLMLLLGTSVALSFSGAVYTGVLTGRHCWALHHGIYAATNILTFAGMMAVMLAGRGIVWLAAVKLVTELLGRVVRAVMAYRVCPGLSIRLGNADLKTLRSMLSFGGRMFVGRMSQVLMIQTTSVLIAGHLGPAALALFTRPRSLVRQAAVFPQKYAFMLVPSVAALAGAGREEEMRAYVKDSSRNGLWMALPVLTFLAVAGPLLMELWMGPRYADPLLILLMTLAFAGELANMPLNSLLMGLNLHGRPGVVSLLAAGVAILLVWLALFFDRSLPVVALALGLPWFFAHGLYLPWYACRRLELPLGSFLREVWLVPVSCMIPFGLCLLAGRLAYPGQPLAALASGALPGGLILAWTCWRWALPVQVKEKLIRHLRCRIRRDPGRRSSSDPSGAVQPVTAVHGQSDTNTSLK